MINWYKEYDVETYQREFDHIDYRRYNPYSQHSAEFFT